MTRPFPYVDGVTHRFVEARGLRFHVAEAGEGDPLVMLHGWPQHWWVYRHQIPPLARRYRVICPDLRGFGWSDAPARGYEKENLARDVLALLDALGIGGEVRLVGHDWGGWIGFLLCLHRPERVRRFLALNIIPPSVRVGLRTVRGLWRLWYQFLIASPWLGERVVRDSGFLRRALTVDTTRPGGRTEEELDAFIAPLREPARARASVQLYRTFLLKELPATIAKRREDRPLRTDTLLLFGARDFAIDPVMLQGHDRFADRLRIELVDDSGHFITEDKPELVTERALTFFAD
jgi:pimeloyl-ACP methyl ester carboxylesterase